MSPQELIEDLKQRGVRLTALGSRLRVRAPAGSVTPQLREALTANKPALLEMLTGPSTESSEFHYSSDALSFGDVCEGWTPASWAMELRRKASRCEEYRPDIADNYRRWAANIEKRLPSTDHDRGGFS